MRTAIEVHLTTSPIPSKSPGHDLKRMDWKISNSIPNKQLGIEDNQQNMWSFDLMKGVARRVTL
jgi:hypothetical protein